MLIVPVYEELIYRAAILGSLLERMSTTFAVLLVVTAATIMHDAWRVAFPDQILLCMAYIVCRRSLAASIIAHAVANLAVLTPNLLIAFHFVK